jgi:hypothetical protein
MVGSVNRKIVVQAGLGKKRDLISKITRARRTENMAQVVEYLLESTKPLNSNPVPPKKKKTQKLLNLTQQHINQIIQHNCCNLNLECPPMAYVLRVWSPEWWYWKVVKTLGGGLQQETSKLLEVCPKENYGTMVTSSFCFISWPWVKQFYSATWSCHVFYLTTGPTTHGLQPPNCEPE